MYELGILSRHTTQGDTETLEIIQIGADFRTSSLDSIEHCSRAVGDEVALLSDLLSRCGFEEVVLLSTCSRIEFYVVSSDGTSAAATLRQQLRLLNEDVAIHERRGRNAVRHLVAVAAGLESALLGEHEILGQVRRAHLKAREAESVGTILGRLFEQAVRSARSIRSQLGVDKEKRSLTNVAMGWMTNLRPTGAISAAVVVGAGETAMQMAEQLKDRGVRDIFVLNRRVDKAERMAERLGVRSGSIHQLAGLLDSVDIVVCATSSPDPIVKKHMLSSGARRRTREPLVIVDLGVPRNVDVGVSELPDVELLAMGSILSLAVAGSDGQQQGESRVDALLERAAEEYLDWLEIQTITPVFKELQEYFESTVREQIVRSLPDGNSATDANQTADRIAGRVSSKLLHPVFIGLKEVAVSESPRKAEQLARSLILREHGRSGTKEESFR